MKVLSLLQPWATLVVIGAKKIETRSWGTKFRGDILIHASKKMTNLQKDLCKSEPFAIALKDIEELKLGGIIGKVKIVAILTTEVIQKCPVIPYPDEQWIYNDHEEYFGDYSPGRYGWMLSSPVQFTHFIPVNGSLGLWDFDQPICHSCGCTDNDCSACILKTDYPCHWVEENLCSACVPKKFIK